MRRRRWQLHPSTAPDPSWRRRKSTRWRWRSERSRPRGCYAGGSSASGHGLRREQSASRADVQVIELDRQHDGIVKLNPLAGWSEAQVWAYIRAHDVPYNALYDRGYTSIGCAPCTRPIAPGEDARAGRWWW